jgi:SAM-dependent MidA family methyltransferase
MNLEQRIISKVHNSGSISFRDFMNEALYSPGLGYYTSSGQRIGKRGDFFTSPYISGAFGAMMGRQLEQMQSDFDGLFTIVEYGAGSGLMCRDILHYLKNNNPSYSSVRYVVVEKNSTIRDRICCGEFSDKIVVVEDIDQLGSFEGCVISNELFDNFPVHRISKQLDKFVEIWIGYQEGFFELFKPLSIEISEYIDSLSLNLTEGHCTEICLDAADWYQKLSKFLNKGYVLTVDYGYLNQPPDIEYGTLRCYKNHQVNKNPYQNPGTQDITADVNFAGLNYWGYENGFELNGCSTQMQFLRALGFVSYLYDMKETEENKRFALTTLLYSMGDLFKVLIQRRNLPYRRLQGLSLANPLQKKLLQTI